MAIDEIVTLKNRLFGRIRGSFFVERPQLRGAGQFLACGRIPKRLYLTPCNASRIQVREALGEFLQRSLRKDDASEGNSQVYRNDYSEHKVADQNQKTTDHPTPRYQSREWNKASIEPS